MRATYLLGVALGIGLTDLSVRRLVTEAKASSRATGDEWVQRTADQCKVAAVTGLRVAPPTQTSVHRYRNCLARLLIYCSPTVVEYTSTLAQRTPWRTKARVFQSGHDLELSSNV